MHCTKCKIGGGLWCGVDFRSWARPLSSTDQHGWPSVKAAYVDFWMRVCWSAAMEVNLLDATKPSYKLIRFCV
uniref:Uncharacterized protein n=1 Tax=Pygocentrus nattereri TaxID=42514 RepID=A0AAR2JYZ5_PYGNA